MAGGDARLLVSHAANESQPVYSPDGRTLAFVSDRTGGGDIYLLTLATGDLRRLTFDDGNELLDAWSRDGQWIYFSSSTRDIAGNDIYRVRASGGTPMPVSADRFTNEFFAAPSPDGQSIAFSARGNGPGQWWRKGHSHLDESEIWIMRGLSTKAYEKVVDRGAKRLLADVERRRPQPLLHVRSQRRGEHLGRSRSPAGARQITQFKDGRVLWPTISYDGRTIVFERDFGIWKLDIESGQRGRGADHAGAARPSVRSTEHLTPHDGFQDLALSPDGRKVAFVGARRDLRGVGARRRRRGARDEQPRARIADRLGARQPAHRLRLRARRRARTCSCTTSPPARNAAHEGREGRRGAEVLA